MIFISILLSLKTRKREVAMLTLEGLLDRCQEDTARICSQGAANRLGNWITPDTYALIVTRGHNHDEEALFLLVNRGARYVGMIGSRRKIKVTFDDLRQIGVSEEQLAKVHAPVGLDIGAVTVEEIGVSIAAQMVQVRRMSRRKAVRGPFPVSEPQE